MFQQQADPAAAQPPADARVHGACARLREKEPHGEQQRAVAELPRLRRGLQQHPRLRDVAVRLILVRLDPVATTCERGSAAGPADNHRLVLVPLGQEVHQVPPSNTGT